MPNKSKFTAQDAIMDELSEKDFAASHNCH